jgi:hypothetical protein
VIGANERILELVLVDGLDFLEHFHGIGFLLK